MAVLPDSILERIIFLEQRMSLWANNAVEIGLTPEQVGVLETLVLAARSKHNAALTARNASKLATQELYTAAGTMTSSASEMIQTIRLFAESTQDPEVYDLANIPAPSPPKPAGPPPQPTEVSHHCQPDGSVLLKWKGSLSHGAFFKVYRRMTGEGSFSSIGAVAAKSLIDDTVPAGTHQAIYYIVGQRGIETGPASEWYTVNFGNQTESGESGGLALAA